jgi:hypothetical protein
MAKMAPAEPISIAGRRPNRSTMRKTKTAVPQALMMPKIPVASRPVSVPVNPMDETITCAIVSKSFSL